MTSQRDGFASYLVAQDHDTTVDLVNPGVVLAIGAHPDDVEFGCGATLAKWSRRGTEVHVAILTDGRRGTWNVTEDQLALAVTREAEAKRAAAILGATTLNFYRQIDGELKMTAEIVMQLVALMRSLCPDVVITHDPWKRYRLHPDHRVTGEIVIDALVRARDATFWPELSSTPARPNNLLLFEADVEDHHETLSQEHLTTKAKALACHQSQYQSSYGLRPNTPDATEQLLARLSDVARDPASATYQEHFKRITDL